MKISQMIRFFILFLVCISLSLQANQQKSSLSLNQTFELHLSENESKQYSLTIPQRQHKSSDLYIHSMPKYSDPFEMPYLTITSENNFSKECFSASAEFAGICHIGSKDLVGNRTFYLLVKCASSCDLTFHIYENSNVVLQLGESLKLTAYQQAGLTQIIEVKVPKELSFTGLAVMAVILNLEQCIQIGDQGVDLYVEYENTTFDNLEERQYKIRGESLNGGGKGAFIYSNQTNIEGIIKCMVKIKKGVSIRFSIISLNEKQLNIDLGKSYFDYANNQTPKVYTLNTSSYSINKNNKTLEIVFDIYSGNPDFIISFDKNFTKNIEYNRKASAVSVLLAPQVRKDFNFKDMIYIKVTSEFSSEFYFYTNFIRNDVTFIEPYFAYLDQIPQKNIQNYIMTQTFKFPQGSNDTYKNYSFKIEIFEGFGKFYFKRCKQYQRKSSQNPSFKECLVNNESYFTTRQYFDEQIQNKHILAGNLLTISMLYDVSQCTQISNKQGFIITKCAYLIAAVGQSRQHFQFSLLPERNYFANYLRQNKIIKEYIPKNNYAFYVFSLPEISSVSEIDIFVTTFSGDTALIVSSTDKLPTLQTNSNKIIKQSGAKNNIVLKKDQLTPQIYISVFAYQFTQINIGVIVHRNGSNSSTIHYIPLNQNNIQTYTINKTQPSAYFRLPSKNSTQISVLVNELQGRVEMLILDSSEKPVTCIDKGQNSLICKFYPQAFSNYSVKVYGDPKQQSKFAITYKTQKKACFSGKLNQPLYVTLESNIHQCFSFNINRQIFIIFEASFTHLQMFDQQIKVKLLINQKEYTTINAPHKIITIEDMIQFCPMGLSLNGFPMTCELTLVFMSNINSTSYFSFVMEEEDAEIALFDGVNQKIKGKSIQIGASKNFYYPVSSETSIQIYFTSKSLNLHYLYAAKFVTKQVFLSRNSANNNIYLPYIPEVDRPRQNVSINRNYFSGVLKQIGLIRLVIDSSSIKKYCAKLDCYLIISIYPQQSIDSSRIDQDQYQIQVSQQETYLALGDSKIGMLNKGEIYTYLVDPENAFIEFKLVDWNGVGSICLVAQAALSNGTIVKGNQLKNDLQVSKSQKVQRIYVKGQKDGCSFEIKYISNKHPFQNVQISHPYDIKVANGETVRFVYYHPHPRPFRIIQMVSTGQPSIFVMPIAENTLKLSSLDKLSYSQFPVFASYEGEYSIQITSPHFCSSCYYYVVITTSNKFVGQIIFLRPNDPIPLSTKHIFKHTLQPKVQRNQQRFVFYSLTTVNITFNVLSGRLKVNIKDPQGNAIVQQQIYEETTFKIKSLEYKQKQQVQYYSEKAKFQITISTKQETQYYIELNKNQISSRIFEGFPSTILIEDVMPQTIEFINGQSLDKPLNLMIDLTGKNSENVNLTFLVTAQNKEGRTIQSQKIIRNITKSDDTYAISMNNVDARYFLAIITNIPINITILLVKTSLIYISPKRNYLFQHEGVYQIYSNNQNVLVEVFACQGEVNLIGSRDEKQMAFDYYGDGSIIIKKPNYGGHYVFGLQTQFSSYYVRVTNKFKDQPLQYLINYYYFDSLNPYDAIDAPSYEVYYELKGEGIYVSVKGPQLLDTLNSTISIKKIDYIAYASTSKYDLNRNSRCNINGNVVKKSSNEPNMTLDFKMLSQLYSSNFTEKLFITVQASISIEMTRQDQTTTINFPTTLTVFYNLAQVYTRDIRVSVSQIYSTKKYWFTDNLFLFLGWIALLTFISMVIPYFLLKICIRKLMMRQQSMVEDIEMAAPNQNQTGTTEEKMGSATNIPFPSSQPIIKESI